ncbi:sodium:proton antiporter [bacterium]|nr:sodium:proton antiporter [bacterium]
MRMPFAGKSLVVLFLSVVTAHAAESGAVPDPAATPSLVWAIPFLLLLAAIALLPQIRHSARWWEHNRNRLLVSLSLSAVICLYYLFRSHGMYGSEPGIAAVLSLLRHAILGDYFPFIVLLFSLFAISGGIRLTGDIPAHPMTNTLFLLLGSILANLIGTTGASMLLIRPLLQINSERKHVTHTVVFFIFLVSNIGGCLLPIGDPPLFLGYLRGVPFFWTMSLFAEWAVCVLLVLAVYWLIDHRAWRRESRNDISRDERAREPIRLAGGANFVLLAILVLVMALFVPGQAIPGTRVIVPNIYLREWIQLALVGVSFWMTPKTVREANRFHLGPIKEVACIFFGIFITVQVPLEILKIKGPSLGLETPLQYFWATGILSSILDNAPTYLVFFETGGSLPPSGTMLGNLHTATAAISVPILQAISCGAVFMGALTYIGNGPNFMVRSMAEEAGIRMPSFLGYLGYSAIVLTPVFVVISFLFFI